MVKDHDYESLFKLEIENRRNFFYPPFARIIKITFQHKESATAGEAAELMVQGLQRQLLQFYYRTGRAVVNKIGMFFCGRYC